MNKIKSFNDFFTNQTSEDEDVRIELGAEETPSKPDDEIDPDLNDPDMDMEDEEGEEESLEEKADPLLVTSKDIMRIHDIMTKSEGNMEKAKKLASTMAKLITDKWKAIRRARAAEREGEDILADIFMQRARELGAFAA